MFSWESKQNITDGELIVYKSTKKTDEYALL